jgi:endoglucanase
LVSVHWYGLETTNYVPAGLNFQSYKTILTEIKQLGFNSIRLSISEQMIRYNSKLHVNKRYIKKDPELKGLHPLQVLDRIVAEAHKLGLYLILDNHSSVASSPRSSHIEALWNRYTERGWIHDWETVAKRYKDNPTVIGFDLRNEPHTSGPGPWSLKTYLQQGATWGPYPSKLWKSGTDWPRAATLAGNGILAINPHALIFVEGVQLYPQKSAKRGVETYWWGSILKGVKTEQVVLNVPHQLVYSPHEWGPGRTRLSQFNSKTSFASLSKVFNANWGFILKSKNPRIQAPIWLGEFNTYNDAKKYVVSSRRGSQGQWFQILVKYLKQNPEIGWSYFPINGTNAVDEPSTNSILNRHWNGVKLPLLMKTLKPIMSRP